MPTRTTTTTVPTTTLKCKHITTELKMANTVFVQIGLKFDFPLALNGLLSLLSTFTDCVSIAFKLQLVIKIHLQNGEWSFSPKIK